MARFATETRLSMGYQEYHAWVDEDDHSEWVDGVVTVFVSQTTRHAEIKVFLTTYLSVFADIGRLGKTYIAPLEMRLRAGRSYREPDLLFVGAAHLDRITKERVEGPADLVVEIVSDDSAQRDRVEKFAVYAEAGIPEYWIVEGRIGRTGTSLFALASDGKYASVPPETDGRLHSRMLPGFWLDPAWLAADPLPTVVDCLREIVPGVFRQDG